MGLLFTRSLLIVMIPSLFQAAQAENISIPPCPPESQRFYLPPGDRPLWTGCKDKKGLYQGLLFEFSNQSEILRIASVKNSLRHGKEIRAGIKGTLEERHYLEGHLHQGSFLFKSDSQLGRLIPKTLTSKDWQLFLAPSNHSFLKDWVKTTPYSVIDFSNGRLSQAFYKNKLYHFKIAPDGRIFALDHPEIKKNPLVDPEALWVLNSDDLKKALLPGFGSCVKYAGPIGRFTRNYDHLLYKRESNEKKHLEKLKQMRDRFIAFCFPEDLKENLGVLECPPHLPSTRPPHPCLLSYSDQIRIPYEPKYFKFEFTLKKSPEDFLAYLNQSGFKQFQSNAGSDLEILKAPDGRKIQVKKVARTTQYRVLEEDAKAVPEERDWWTWHDVPGQ